MARYEGDVGAVGRLSAEYRQRVEVLLGGQGEGQGRHGQQEIPLTRREPIPITLAKTAETAAVMGMAIQERDAAVDQAGPEKGTQAGERHLPERDLTGPAGQHGQGRGADGVGQELRCRAAGRRRGAVTASGRMIAARPKDGQTEFVDVSRVHQYGAAGSRGWAWSWG